MELSVGAKRAWVSTKIAVKNGPWVALLGSSRHERRLGNGQAPWNRESAVATVKQA